MPVRFPALLTALVVCALTQAPTAAVAAPHKSVDTIRVAPAQRSSSKLVFNVKPADARKASAAKVIAGKHTVAVDPKRLTSRKFTVRLHTTASERKSAALVLTVPVTTTVTTITTITTVTTTKRPTSTDAASATTDTAAPQTTTTTAPTAAPADPAAVSVPSTGQPAPGPGGAAEIGLSTQLRWMAGSTLEAAAQRLQDMGVTVAREDLAWGRIESTPGVYDWSFTDDMVAAAARHHIRILPIPDKAPDWATGAWNMEPVSGSAEQKFIAFVKAAVQRYGSTGTFWAAHPELPKTPFIQWDILNEPMWKYAWANSPLPDPVAYGTMFRDLVATVRPIDPQAQYLLEADTSVPESDYPRLPWLGAALKVPGILPYVDGISLHDYTNDPSHCTPFSPSLGVDVDYQATWDQFCRVLDTRRILNAAGLQNAKIWITETGDTTSTGPRGVTEARQAEIVHEEFDKLREWHVVSGLIWYQMNDAPSAAPDDDEGWFGLRRPDGSLKPAYTAFVQEVAKGLPSPS